MMVIGIKHLDALHAGRVADAKMVFNHRGAIIFPSRLQHRDMKVEGISYEDKYAGTALAAMLRANEIEVRFHQAFDDREVARIIATLLAQPELASLAIARVTYQGRPLKV
jgi:hypothetical protein